MYYDNKSKFYIKQYGPLIFIIAISIALIACGVFIFLTGNTKGTPPIDDNVVADLPVDKPIENEQPSGEEEPKKENDEAVMTWINNMQVLEKSDIAVIESINEFNEIILKLEDKKIKVSLIGLDYTNTISNISELLNQDLKDKDVRIAFDNKKVDNDKVYAYLYIEDKLYNETALENGYTKLSEVGENNSILNTLKQAQAYAKQTKAGVWNVE